MTVIELEPQLSNSARVEKVRTHLQNIGLKNIADILHNPSYEELIAAETDEA